MKTEFETAKYWKADEVAPASWTAPVLWRFWIESHTFTIAFCLARCQVNASPDQSRSCHFLRSFSFRVFRGSAVPIPHSKRKQLALTNYRP